MSAITLTRGVHLVASGPLGISHPLDCHAYLIETAAGHLLVDAGVGLHSDRIVQNIRSLALDPGDVRLLLLTHAHADHAGGAAALAAATGAEVVGDARELRLLARGTDDELGLRAAKRNGTYPEDYVYPHLGGGWPLDGGWRFQAPDALVTSIATPGHSRGSTSYLLERDGYRALFSGDAVFLGGFVSVLNVEGSDPADYRRCLPALAGLAVEGLYPGHYLFAVGDGQKHVDLALRRLQSSVLPNVALSWLPYPQL